MRLTDRLRRFRNRGRRYAETLRWLIADALRNFRYRFLGIMAAQFLGTSCQAGALAALLIYIDHLERGAPIDLPRTAYAVDPSGIFGPVALGCFVLLVIGGCLTFVAKRETIELSLRYEVMFGRRLLRAFGVLPTDIREGTVPLSRALMCIRRVQSRDSLHAARSLRILLRGSGQLITFAYASLAAVYLSPVGFGIILAAILGFAGLYYWANVYAARSARRLEVVRPRANQRWNAAAQALGKREDRIDPDDPMITRTYNSAPMRRTRESFSGRLSAPVYSELFGNLGLAFAMLSAIFFMGVPAMQGLDSWSFVLAFVMAVQFAMVSFRGVIQSLTSFARLYPGSRRCFDIYRSDVHGEAEQRGGPPPAVTAVPVVASVASNPDPDMPARVDVCPGAPVALLSSVEPTRYTVGALLYVMTGRDEALAKRIAGRVAILDAPFMPAGPCSLREALGVPGGAAGRAPDSLLARSEFAGRFLRGAGSDPDRRLAPKRWGRLPTEVLANLTIARALLSQSEVILLHRSVVNAGGSNENGLLAELFDKKTVFIYDIVTGRSLPAVREEPVIVVGDGGVLILSSANGLPERADDVLGMLKEMHYADQRRAVAGDDNGEEEE